MLFEDGAEEVVYECESCGRFFSIEGDIPAAEKVQPPTWKGEVMKRMLALNKKEFSPSDIYSEIKGLESLEELFPNNNTNRISVNKILMSFYKFNLLRRKGGNYIKVWT
jgi:hypothetical protein